MYLQKINYERCHQSSNHTNNNFKIFDVLPVNLMFKIIAILFVVQNLDQWLKKLNK